jgi:hypothetical protein
LIKLLIGHLSNEFAFVRGWKQQEEKYPPSADSMAKGQDFFTVALQTPTGQVLPSIEYDGQRYFVGEPGQEFVVTVTRSLRYPSKLYRVSLEITCRQKQA